MKKNLKLLILCISFFCFLPPSRAENSSPAPDEADTKGLAAVEYLCGFGTGEVREKDDSEIFPILIGLDFNLLSAAHELNLYPPGLLQLRVEPFFSYMAQPSRNIETGVSFLIKIGLLPEASRFQPYFLGGLGAVYMTLQTASQATQVNFIEQAGLGGHFFIDENWALTAECRFRHLSNADIKKPNKGMNTLFITAGLTYRF